MNKIEHLVGYWKVSKSGSKEVIAKIDLKADGDLIYLINGQIRRGRWFWRQGEEQSYFVLAFKHGGQEVEEQWFCEHISDQEIRLIYQQKAWVWKKWISPKGVNSRKIEGTWVCFEIDGQHIKYTNRVHELHIDSQRIAIYQGGQARAASAIAYGSGYITLDNRMVWEILHNSEHLLKVKQHSGQVCYYTKSKHLSDYQRIHQLEDWKGVWQSLQNPQQQILIGEQQRVVIKEVDSIRTYKGDFDTTGYFLNIKQSDYSIFLNEDNKEVLTVYSKSGRESQYYQQVSTLHPLELSEKLLGVWKLAERGTFYGGIIAPPPAMILGRTIYKNGIKWDKNEFPTELRFLPNLQFEYWDKWDNTVVKEAWEGDSLKLNLNGEVWKYYNGIDNELIFKHVIQETFLKFNRIKDKVNNFIYQIKDFVGHWISEDGKYQFLLEVNGKFKSKHQGQVEYGEWRIDHNRSLLILGNENMVWGINFALSGLMFLVDLKTKKKIQFQRAVAAMLHEENYERLLGTWELKYQNHDTYELTFGENQNLTFHAPKGNQNGSWELLPSLTIVSSIPEMKRIIQNKDGESLTVEYEGRLYTFKKQTETKNRVIEEVSKKLCGHWYFTKFDIGDQQLQDACLHLAANQSAELCVNGNYKKARWTVRQEDRYVLEITSSDNIKESWKINMLTAEKVQFSTSRYDLLECERLVVLDAEGRKERINYLLGGWHQVQESERIVPNSPHAELLTFTPQELIIQKQGNSQTTTHTWRLSGDGSYIIINEEYIMFIVLAFNSFFTVIQGGIVVKNFVSKKSIGEKALAEIKESCMGHWRPMKMDPREDAALIIGENTISTAQASEDQQFPYYIHPSGRYLIMDAADNILEWMLIFTDKQGNKAFNQHGSVPTLQVYDKGRMTEEPIIFRKLPDEDQNVKSRIQGVWQVTKQVFIDIQQFGQIKPNRLDAVQQGIDLLNNINFKYTHPERQLRFVWGTDGICQIINAEGKMEREGQWELSPDGQTIVMLDNEQIIDILDLNSTDCIIKIEDKIFNLERLESVADVHQFTILNTEDLIGIWSDYAGQGYMDPNVIMGEKEYTLDDHVIQFNEDGTFLETKEREEYDVGTWSVVAHLGYIEISSLEYGEKKLWLLERTKDRISLVDNDRIYYLHRTLEKEKYEALQEFVCGQWKHAYPTNLTQRLSFKKGGKLEVLTENQHDFGNWYLHRHGQALTLIIGDDQRTDISRIEIDQVNKELILITEKGTARQFMKC